MINRFNIIDPKNQVWNHNLAHVGDDSGNNKRIGFRSNIESGIEKKVLKKYEINNKESLKVRDFAHVSFKGSKYLELGKRVAQEFAPLNKKSAGEVFNQVKDFLDEPMRLAFEKAIKASKKGPLEDIIISKPIQSRFVEAFVTPFKSLSNGLKYVFSSPEARKAIKEQKSNDSLINNLAGVYRQIIKHEDKSKEELRAMIDNHINRGLNKNKTNYSTNQSAALIRMTSGFLSGFFVANDFYNLRRMVDDNAKESKKEWNSKFKQVMIGIGLATYLGFLTNTTFKQAVNSSIKFALGAAIISQLAIEVISRKITGRPVLIQWNRDQAQNSQTKTDNNTLNTFAKYIQLINNQKIGPDKPNSISFSGQPAINKRLTPNSQVSFTGAEQLIKTISTMKRDKFVNMMQLLKEVDVKRYDKVIDAFQKQFNTLGEKLGEHYKGANVRDIVEKGAFEGIKEIPTGRNLLYNLATRTWDAVIIPFKLIQMAGNFIKKKVIGGDPLRDSIKNAISNAFNNSKDASQESISATIKSSIADIMAKDSSKASNDVIKTALNNAVKDYIKNNQQENVKNVLNGIIKETKTLPFDEVIDTPLSLSSVYIKNSFNFLEKARKASAGNLSDVELLNKVKTDKNLLDSIKANYGGQLSEFSSAEKATYEGAKASTMFKLSGMTGVPFLFMETYNVAGKEGIGHDVSLQRAKERTAQDFTRQLFSSWIVAGANNIFREFYNNSIWGAALATVGTVLSYETLTRTSVGTPVLPRSKSQIEEIDAKCFEKKGLSAVWFRVMSRLSGKKPLSEFKGKLDNRKNHDDRKLTQSILLDQPRNNSAVTSNQNDTYIKSPFIQNSALIAANLKK